MSERWYFEAIGIPEYAAGADGLGEAGTVYCKDFPGKSSYFEYTCNPETELYELYVNISMTDEEAKQIQAERNANGEVGVLPFRKLSYN